MHDIRWEACRLSACALSVALLCALLAFASACSGGPSANTTSPGTSWLPRFVGWRIGFLSSDLLLHAVSTDGKSDVAGASAPGLTGPGSQNLGITSGGFSPDGHLLSYEGVDGLYVSDVTGNVARTYSKRALAYTQVWSLDSKLLAYLDGPGDVKVLRLSDGRVTPVPSSSSLAATQILGWVDNAHLAVIAAPPFKIPTTAPHSTPTEVSSGGSTSPSTQSVALYVLDVPSGALRPLVTLTSATMGIPTFSLAADGTTALYSNRPLRDQPFAPDVALIDMKTGVVTHLPHTASATGAWYAGVAWLPGARTAAVSQGFYLTGQYKTWLLDTAHDTATPLAATQGVAAGWVPGSHMLILTTGTPDSTAIGRGPYTISAVPDPLANPQGSAITLTKSAYTFPSLGFVRTA